MQIQQMFSRDINRYINGVVSVGEEETIKQELEEYVVTRELQRHFDTFFGAYELGLDNPARNVGVWIQGYFGSGKSHLLKMLSYLLENKTVAGKPTVDYFDGKFEDEMTYAKVRRAANVPAETILFNIDVLGGGYKEGTTAETAVLRSIANAFYDHLGLYGTDYKLAKFEKEIDDLGKTQQFRERYEELTGYSWLERRKSYRMRGSEIAKVAHEVLGVTEESIMTWLKNKDTVTVDFGELVDDINQYALKREQECGGKFRLLFMVDEMGQYLNGDVSRMLNLQTLVEQFCDKCGGRVWMVVTSQEAIDEMVNVVSMDFSKIQGRFATRLSLSSSSVDEVIKKRVLEKNKSAKIELQGEYQSKSAILKNLFSFEDSRGDLKGYATEGDFVESFPFVGYQFTLMPDVMKEIRKHGYQGKSLSTGERSMLSSYQEAAQSVEENNETSLVPFWRFFDTLEKELDHGIKQVFERCRKAAESCEGLMPQDVNVLKTLYLINYISSVKPTVGNIAILLIDDMGVDKISLRESVSASLDRLVHEDYVARNGERYSFLTDEEQDVAREIRDVKVDPSAVVESIKKIVFEKIFISRKFRKGPNDFPVDRYVDDTIHGQSQGGMKLNLVTMANTALSDASDAELDLRSVDQALIVLDTESDYYEVLFNAEKIATYVKSINVQQLPETKQRIIMSKNKEASTNRAEAEAMISDAIVKARVSVNGRGVQVAASNAKQKIEGVLEELVDAIFTKANYITVPIENDGQLANILKGYAQKGFDGMGGGNEDAIAEVAKYLDVRNRTYQPTSMGDIQRCFQMRPYGWREIDIAAVVAQLIVDQKVSLTYGGAQIMPADPKMKDYLRKQSETDKVTVKIRTKIAAGIISKAKSLLRELDGAIAIPSDEDGLVQAVRGCLGGRIEHYRGLLKTYQVSDGKYPGKCQIEEAIAIAQQVLAQQADAETFLKEFTKREGEILDNLEDLEDVEKFFNNNQKALFDDACALISTMQKEAAYVAGDMGVQNALASIVEIVGMSEPYKRIHELPGLGARVNDFYDKIVSDKREDVLSSLSVSFNEVKQYAEDEGSKASAQVGHVLTEAEWETTKKKNSVHSAKSCSALDALNAQINAWREACFKRIDEAVTEATKKSATSTQSQPVVKVKVLERSKVLPVKVLRSEAEVAAYVDDFKDRLLSELKDNDSIRLS